MTSHILKQAHQDFLRRFQDREAKLGETTTPDKLSNAQHATLRKKLETTDFIPPVWSPATQKGLFELSKRWEK